MDPPPLSSEVSIQSRTVILSAAAVILFAAAVSAHSGEASASAPVWVGRSVVLAPLEGRAMAPACPELRQIRHLAEQHGRWERSAVGCRYMLGGNFINALVVDDAGDFVRVRYTLTRGRSSKFLPREDTFWTPRDHYRLAR